VGVVLISTYDMGRQSFGLASPAAWLRESGVEVSCVDLAKQRLPDDPIRRATHVGFFLPMHTATRLALPAIDAVRAINPQALLIAYGLYAPLNEELLRAHGVSMILGGEFEADLLRSVIPRSAELQLRATDADHHPIAGSGTDDAALKRRATNVPRLRFRVPDRTGLLPLTRYATLQTGDDRKTVGYTEASRGCKHRCRHCPIVPVYDGQFRIVPAEVVLADIRAQVAAGARHITFGDPDFLNGPRHAIAVVERLARECPGVSYDVTIKVEHLLKQAPLLPALRDTGCAFVTSAVEALDDRVLAKLEKGHTRADFERAVTLCRETGLTLVPTFVAFTPWTTLEGYLDLLQTTEGMDLVDHVAPIQLAIRLLIPEGSRMLELSEVRAMVSSFSAVSLTYPWTHADPRVDALHERVSSVVARRLRASRRDVFAELWEIAHDHAGRPVPALRDTPLVRAAVPYLNEPWYC
jgi:radical SAM superfamily enzyme YgiQ (UPF0313 family)